MNDERKKECDHLVNEAQELIRQIDLKLNADQPKYESATAWRQAITALSDKLMDVLTEERNTSDAESYYDAKETKAHVALEESVVYLEHALNHCNAGLDSVENDDFEQARTEFNDMIHQLKKAMDC